MNTQTKTEPVTAAGIAPRENQLLTELATLIRSISDDTVSLGMRFTEISDRQKQDRETFYQTEIRSARAKLEIVIEKITDNPEAMDLLDTISTLNRRVRYFVRIAGQNTTSFSADGYSKYYKRLKASETDPTIEVYGYEQAMEHIAELRQHLYDRSKIYRDSKFEIVKETTIEETAATVPAA